MLPLNLMTEKNCRKLKWKWFRSSQRAIFSLGKKIPTAVIQPGQNSLRPSIRARSDHMYQSIFLQSLGPKRLVWHKKSTWFQSITPVKLYAPLGWDEKHPSSGDRTLRLPTVQASRKRQSRPLCLKLEAKKPWLKSLRPWKLRPGWGLGNPIYKDTLVPISFPIRSKWITC